MNRYLEQFKAQLLADKKKAGIMVGLVCVGLLLWGRLMLKNAPKSATAVPTPVAQAPQPTSRKPQRVATDIEYDVTVVLDIPTGLPRDLFALDTTGYRVVKNEVSQVYDPNAGGDTPDIVTVTLDEVKEAAMDLRLEGVVWGDDPTVIINGQLLRVGQTIEQFKVHKIEERKVVLEMGGVYIRMSM